MRKLIVLIISIVFLFALSSCNDPCKSGHRSFEYIESFPTCTTNGTIVEVCTVCNQTINIQIIDKSDHVPSNEWIVVTEATCSSAGEQNMLCKVCNAVINVSRTDMSNHIEGEWQTDVEYTCTTDGTEIKKCIYCEKSLDTKIVPAAHKTVTLSAVSPTCTKNGLTEGSKCSVCDEVLIAQQNINKLGHDYVKVAAVEPKCNAYGYTEGSQCSVCKIWKIEPVRIDKLKHTEVKDDAKAATCTQNGLTAGVHCSVCKTTITPQKTINKLGHDYNVYNNTCTRCPAQEYHEIATRQEIIDYSGNYDAVIYLDKCINTSNTSEYCTLTVGIDAKYIRLVGTAGVDYNLQIVVDSARKNSIKIDMVNVSLKTLTNNPVIQSSANVKVELGFYGTKCNIIGRDGANGENGSLSNLNYSGKNGSAGNDAISIAGDLIVTMAADYVQIKGGNGGKGGDGMDAAPAPQDGGKGGNGGNGGYAIKASSITVIGSEGHSATSILLAGGSGGKGGFGGEGFLWGSNGSNGSSGSSQSATTVKVTYK